MEVIKDRKLSKSTRIIIKEDGDIVVTDLWEEIKNDMVVELE